MRVNLLYENRDFEYDMELSRKSEIVIEDLGFNIIFNAMTKNEKFVMDVVKKVIFKHLTEESEITFRQDILKDMMENPDFLFRLYALIKDTLSIYKENRWFYYWNYETSYYDSLNLLVMLIEQMQKMQDLFLSEKKEFKSKGMTRLRKLFCEDYDKDYLLEVKKTMVYLKEERITYIQASVSDNLYGRDYLLLDYKKQKKNRLKWFFAPKFELADRDDRGLSDLNKRRTIAYSPISKTVIATAKELFGFINKLHFELAFYLGCLNLHDEIINRNASVVFPVISSDNSFKDLKNIGLLLFSNNEVIGSNIKIGDKNPVFITGANQGGKSTFVRSIGQAQIMMQAGIFVTAGQYHYSISKNIFTHFKKEEDREMQNGKLAEELQRMDDIVKQAEPGSMILFNESFSSTNELEGSEIGKQIINALIEKDIAVLYVTHFYYLTDNFINDKQYQSLSLRAEILPDKTRTHRMILANPEASSNGIDLFEKIFAIK